MIAIFQAERQTSGSSYKLTLSGFNLTPSYCKGDCGDALVQGDHEQCDDGGYGECSAGCVLGPFCGDGNVATGFEECDDSGNEDGDGCSAACKREIIIPK